MIPLKVMETAFGGFELIRTMAETGNPSSITDAGVGALALRSCIRGAFLNVKVNAVGLTDKDFAGQIIAQASVIEQKAIEAESSILKIVEAGIKQ